MKTRYYILLSMVAVACDICMSAQERRMVINNHNSFSQYSIEDVESVTFHEKPAAPVAVKAVVSGDAVLVSWHPVKGCSSYTVERSADGESYVLIGTSEDTAFTDTAPAIGANIYRVRGIGDGDEDSDLSIPSNKVDFQPEGLSATGLYLGIIGFNRELMERDMSILMPSNVSDFTDYVGNLTQAKGTLLYHSVGEAVDMLSSSSLPDDVTSVSIVTFTDGLDQGSLMKSSDDMVTADAYLRNLQQRISNTLIAGKHISAYSIGLRGADVKDVESFRNNLVNLASAPGNAAEVSNLAELNGKFKEIAAHLSETTETQLIKAILTGNPGTKFRLTFDYIADGSSAAESELYIEGTYTRSRDDDGNMHYYFSDISYVGITCSSTDKIEGEMRDDGLVFAFDGVARADGTKLSLDNYKRWRYIPSLDFWQPDEEGGGVSSVTSETVYKSAAIVLVLDCSTSLGSQFTTVKSHANDFIRQMAANTVENDEAQWEVMGTGRFNDAVIANLTGESPQLVNVILQQSIKTPGLYRIVNPWRRFGSNAMLEVDATNPNCVIIKPQPTGIIHDDTSGEITIASQSYIKCNLGGYTAARFISLFPDQNIIYADGVFDFGSSSIAVKMPNSTNPEYDSTQWYEKENSGMRLLLPDIFDSRTVLTMTGDKVALTVGASQAYIYSVDWGDGTSGYYVAGADAWAHEYNSDGDRVIMIEGAPFTSFAAPSSGLTSVSSDNALGITTLLLANNNLANLDLTAYPSLITLDCSDNALSSLSPVNAKNLRELNCSGNKLTTLDCTKCDALLSLDCSHNLLTELDFGATWQFKTNLPLKVLDCSDNQLTNVVMVRLISLEEFDASHNVLRYEGVGYCPLITTVNLSYNELTRIGFGNNPQLISADCSHNSLTFMSLNSPKLTTLDISSNAFDSFDITNLSCLDEFVCVDNPGSGGVFKIFCDFSTEDAPDGYTKEAWDYKGVQVVPLYGPAGNAIKGMTSSSEISLAAGADETFEVVWGDGCRETYTAMAEHSYSDEGSHNFMVIGDITCFDCHSSGVTELQLSGNPLLTEVDCRSNKLTRLNLEANKELGLLNASNNEISSVSFSGLSKIETINLSDNNLNAFTITGANSLKTLVLSNNKLTQLDVTPAIELETLHCDNNLLESLNLENNKSLTTFNGSGNPGVGGYFRVYTWFTPQTRDEGSYSGFSTATWQIDGATVTPLYTPSVSEISFKVTGTKNVYLGCDDTALGGGTYTISWGDGKVETCSLSSNSAVQHVYSTVGNYTVKVKGEMNVFVCKASNITSIDLSGNQRIGGVDVGNNKLSGLKLKYNGQLQTLSIDNNNFYSIDISTCPRLTHFSCTGNYSMAVTVGSIFNKVPSGFTQGTWVRDNETCTVRYYH